ncbi:hypothetical protein EE612_041228 [Oryza sativa]|nr:hypothetical protein EE612_041228 [Oryza sativa]
MTPCRRIADPSSQESGRAASRLPSDSPRLDRQLATALLAYKRSPSSPKFPTPFPSLSSFSPSFCSLYRHL